MGHTEEYTGTDFGVRYKCWAFGVIEDTIDYAAKEADRLQESVVAYHNGHEILILPGMSNNYLAENYACRLMYAQMEINHLKHEKGNRW